MPGSPGIFHWICAGWKHRAKMLKTPGFTRAKTQKAAAKPVEIE
jgi:hypothetical protein